VIGEANLNTGEVSVSQAPMSSNRSVQFKSIATEGRRNLGMVTRKSCGKQARPVPVSLPPAASGNRFCSLFTRIAGLRRVACRANWHQ